MSEPYENEAADVVAKLGAEGVRRIGVAALSKIHKSHPLKVEMSIHGEVGLEFFVLAAEELSVKLNALSCKDVFLHNLGQEKFRLLHEFVWWTIRSGYLMPSTPTNGRGTPMKLHLTLAGTRFLERSADGDHPLLPGFLERLKARCSGIADDVLTHLEDARECLEHGLHRPAIVLLGLAYEAAIEHLGERLAKLGKLGGKPLLPKAAERIDQIKQAVTHLGFGREERGQLERALDFAHQLRSRRNDASHATPRYPFDGAAEVEEFIVSACRHLPSLWLLQSVA